MEESRPNPPKERPVLEFFKKLTLEGTELVKEQTESAKTDLALEFKRSVEVLGLFIAAAVLGALTLTALAGFLILFLGQWIETWAVVLGVTLGYGALSWAVLRRARRGTQELDDLPGRSKLDREA